MRQIPVVAPFEILPNKNNTLTLDNRQTDSFGMPLPATLINWTGFEHQVRGFVEKRLTARLARVRRRLFGYGTNGNHPYGTYRMGASRQYGVVDCNLRSFDHENLYILGGGSFVTGTCFNPSLTIAALTFKALNSITDRAFSS
jgi:glucose dehydrogenase